MPHQARPSLRVVLFSSGNPDATYLAAGLLQHETVFIQGVGDAVPAPEVGDVLAELGLDRREWVPQVVAAPPVEPVDVGLTVCVPT